jgi:hypothetical protein
MLPSSPPSRQTIQRNYNHPLFTIYNQGATRGGDGDSRVDTIWRVAGRNGLIDWGR